MVWGGSLAKEWDMGSSGVLCGPLKASWLWLSQVGDEGAGHFVKMVHNGIEYGDMQLICEAYHLMKDVLAMGHAEMAKVSLGRGGAGVLRARSCLTLPPGSSNRRGSPSRRAN